MAKTVPKGELLTGQISREEQAFIDDVAFKKLDAVKDDETLKHFADVWWNLCLWEKQRADVIDSKAGSLLGLASVASAVVAATGLSGSGRPIAVTLFLIAAAFALWALLARDHGGFLDLEVFEALTAATEPVGTPTSSDPDPKRSYLREITLQRWLIYTGFKKVSKTRSGYVKVGQFFAVAAIASLCVLLWMDP
jgi:hypothetical protein